MLKFSRAYCFSPMKEINPFFKNENTSVNWLEKAEAYFSILYFKVDILFLNWYTGL